MPLKNKRFLPFLAAVAVILATAFLLAPSCAAQGPVFPRSTLSVIRADGSVQQFAIEVAKTPEQEAYGLMFRRSLAMESGMLFLFDPNNRVAMWMKNTYIPLDMLFIRPDGHIAKIIHAKPHDLTPLSANEPISAVVELAGGAAAKFNIVEGDQVRAEELK